MAQNFEGFGESSIKLDKMHLYKICLGMLFTFDELSTVLCLIEICSNSRPLKLSTELNDIKAPIPRHF